MNWIIPNKFLAFSCPSSSVSDRDGYTSCTPEHYIAAFKRWGIKLVVRLNKKQYDAKKFTDRGIRHADLFFLDGTCPSRYVYLFQLATGVRCNVQLGTPRTPAGHASVAVPAVLTSSFT